MPSKRVVAVHGPSEEERRRLRQRALERRRKEESWQLQAERTVQEKIDEEARRARERLERCKQEAKVRSERRQKIKENMKKFVPPPETSAQKRCTRLGFPMGSSAAFTSQCSDHSSVQ